MRLKEVSTLAISTAQIQHPVSSSCKQHSIWVLAPQQVFILSEARLRRRCSLLDPPTLAHADALLYLSLSQDGLQLGYLHSVTQVRKWTRWEVAIAAFCGVLVTSPYACSTVSGLAETAAAKERCRPAALIAWVFQERHLASRRQSLTLRVF